jgi:hypothetical protein
MTDTFEVDPNDVERRPVDSKGRVSVGTQYAGETVGVAVVEEPDAPEHPEGVPERCADCGGTIGQTFVYSEGQAFHPDCAGVETDGETA